jgi:hypothetical protein
MHAVAGDHAPAAQALAGGCVRVAVAVRMATGVVVAIAVVVRPGGVLVPVVPELGLVEQEEEHHAQQECGEQCPRAGGALERFGQQMHEGRGQQGARRQAQEVLRPHAALLRAPQAGAQQPVGHPHAADAGRQCGQDN